jgi:hypothetical protein
MTSDAKKQQLKTSFNLNENKEKMNSKNNKTSV